jgi:hypothetical protein
VSTHPVDHGGRFRMPRFFLIPTAVLLCLILGPLHLFTVAWIVVGEQLMLLHDRIIEILGSLFPTKDPWS